MMIVDKIKIILVDDNKIFNEGLNVILSKCPNYYILDSCGSGLELLECPHLHKADIILLDIQMPLMNDLEVAKKINIKYPYIKMLALSMHIDKVFLEDIIEAGFNGFIYKPDTSKKINEVIPRIMNCQFVFPDNLKLKTK